MLYEYEIEKDFMRIAEGTARSLARCKEIFRVYEKKFGPDIEMYISVLREHPDGLEHVNSIVIDRVDGNLRMQAEFDVS